MRHFAILLSILTLSLFLGACGDKKSGGDGSGEAAANDTSTPKGLGDAIGDAYLKCMKDTVALGETGKSAAEIKDDLGKLRAGCIDTMVAFGKLRAALNEADGSTADSALMKKMSSSDRDAFKKFADASKRLQKEDRKVGNDFVNMNTLTQYANYELLKKQLPKEAKRLGIE